MHTIPDGKQKTSAWGEILLTNGISLVFDFHLEHLEHLASDSLWNAYKDLSTSYLLSQYIARNKCVIFPSEIVNLKYLQGLQPNHRHKSEIKHHSFWIISIGIIVKHEYVRRSEYNAINKKWQNHWDEFIFQKQKSMPSVEYVLP